MKHIKLYEQFDFEDFSDEELFGKETFKLIFSGRRFYIVEKIENNIVFLYKGYKWISDENLKKYCLFCLEELGENDEIAIFIGHNNTNYQKYWDIYTKDTLPKEIKYELN